MALYKCVWIDWFIHWLFYIFCLAFLKNKKSWNYFWAVENVYHGKSRGSCRRYHNVVTMAVSRCSRRRCDWGTNYKHLGVLIDRSILSAGRRRMLTVYVDSIFVIRCVQLHQCSVCRVEFQVKASESQNWNGPPITFGVSWMAYRQVHQNTLLSPQSFRSLWTRRVFYLAVHCLDEPC